jgi:two-component system phosphate regulon sensor histidine kinase PhoR
MLAEISQMLTVLDQDRVLERVIELMAKAVDAAKVSLILRPDYADDWQQTFVRRFSGSYDQPPGEEAPQAIHFAQRVLDKGLAGWVFRHKQGAIVYDTLSDDRWYLFPDSDSQARSALCVPFLYNGDVVAVLTMLHPETNHFNDYHLRLMSIVANQATVAVRNAQLFNQMVQQQQQLETILRTIPDHLLVLDDAGKILLINDVAGAMLNNGNAAGLGSFVGQHISDFLHVDSIMSSIVEVLQNPSPEGQMWSFEARSERQRRDFLVTVSHWEHPATDKGGYMVILRDITAMRDLNRFKDEMLKMASHDLRSPLALIVGYCSLIQTDTPPDSPAQEYLTAIQKATERMQGLLDDLLRVEQIRKSPMELNQKVNFLDVVHEAIEHVTPAAEQKQHTLEADLLLDDVPPVSLNPVLIREAMENLIGNAVKYTPENGRILVSAFAQDNAIYFNVEDNGIGIPKEHLERIFETFYRAKQAGSEGVEGRGLGLSLVKTIIERHGGEVWVESQGGSGSRFGFRIPMS